MSTRPPTPLTEIIAFFRFLYEGLPAQSYFRLCAGVNDDTTSTGIRMLMPSESSAVDDPNTIQWWCYDPERPDLLEMAAQAVLDLCALYGNVYTTRTTFRQKQASKKHANPSPILFVDDAPVNAPLSWSLYLTTGTGSGQGFYRCDMPTTQADARGLAHVLRGDKSGSNENKVLRIPCTLNTKTKHGGNWSVQVTQRGPIYTLDQVRAVYPPLESSCNRTSADVDITWDSDTERRLAYWHNNISRLLGPDGLPKAFKNPNTQSRRLLTDDQYRLSFRHPSGSYDASTVRWILTKSFIKYCRYWPEQAAALMYHFEYPETIRIKGSAAVWRDIKTCIDHWLAEYPEVKPSPDAPRIPADFDTPKPVVIQRAKAPERPRKSRARKDRPQKVQGADGYLSWLQEQADAHTNVVMLSQRECAENLDCSPRTIKRYEEDLRARNLIERRAYAQRQAGCIFLLEAVSRSDNIAAPAARTDVSDVVTDDQPVAHQDGLDAYLTPIGGTHPPCAAPVAEPPDQAQRSHQPRCVPPSMSTMLPDATPQARRSRSSDKGDSSIRVQHLQQALNRVSNTHWKPEYAPRGPPSFLAQR